MSQTCKKRSRQDAESVFKKPRSVEEALPKALLNLFLAAKSRQGMKYMSAIEVRALYSLVCQQISTTSVQTIALLEQKNKQLKIEHAECRLENDILHDKLFQQQQPHPLHTTLQTQTSLESQTDYVSAQMLCIMGQLLET